MSKQVNERNFNAVIDAIKNQFENNPEDRQDWIDSLNIMLDELRCEDFFGTEGQNDPRNDILDV